MIEVKILSYKTPQRYAVRRTFMAAQSGLQKTQPDIRVAISEVKELVKIENHTAVVIYPSLVVDEKLVCVGRFPKKDEVVGWLKAACTQAVMER